MATQEVAHHHAPRARPYFIVWGALLVLTALTVFFGRLDLGSGNVVIALGIATTKDTLVALFFMHLAHAEGVNRMALGIAVIFVVLLALGVEADYSTRLPSALPPTTLPPSAGFQAGQ